MGLEIYKPGLPSAGWGEALPGALSYRDMPCHRLTWNLRKEL